MITIVSLIGLDIEAGGCNELITRIAQQTGVSGWSEWLSTEERMMPIARQSVKVAYDAGLDGLTSIISTGIRDIERGVAPKERLNTYLASIWSHP